MKRTLVLLTLLAGAAAAPSHADPAGLLAVTAAGPATADCEGTFDVTGTVTAAGAVGVPRQTVRVLIDGIGLAYGSTDETGTYTVTLAAIAPGDHTIGADIFGGLPLETEAADSTITITGDCEQP